MWLTVSIMLLVLLSFTASALYGFYWAAKNGQFTDLDRSSESIFDADEPVGKATDGFPGETWIRNNKGQMVKGLAK